MVQRAWLVLVLGACTASPDLHVEVRTDLVAGVEFAGLRVRVTDASGAIVHQDDVLAEGAYFEAQRVAELSEVPTGDYDVTVELRGASGIVLARTLRVHLSSTTVVTVLLTRSCVDVVCPNDDPGLTECAGGRCVPPDCTERDDPACDPQCASSDDCLDPPAPCSRAACISGLCFAAPDVETCAGLVCHPELGCIATTTPDAGMIDAGMTGNDAGMVGCATGCDDANPCTDDACDGANCTHTPNTAACDDGVFCNGADTCAAGVCSGHTGDPCPGASICDEAMGTCTGCSGNGDCPAPIYGPFGACGGFAGACGESGMRSRDLTTYVCSAGMCVGSTSTDTEACARDTDGTSCNTTTFGGWSGCNYGNSCDESASESRSTTVYTCVAGSCMGASGSETRACTRDTDGTSCNTTAYGAWSGCGYSSTCDESASESRTVTTYTCMAGSCGGTNSSEMRGCSRDTDGIGCGATSYGAWSGCGYTSTCDESAMESRSVTTYACGGGSCQPNSGSESRGCSRDTDGTMCAATEYGAWSACGGFTTTCDESGTESRSVTTYSCASGSCGSTSGSESRGCTRDTDFMSCGIGGFPCHVRWCEAGACMLQGDTCGAGENCCEFGCRSGLCP
jgi:hypothetical protein